MKPESKMDLELRRLAELAPDEELPAESFHRIWTNIEQHIQPHPMKKLMNYLTKNIQPLTYGALFGILITAVIIRFVLSILFPC